MAIPARQDLRVFRRDPMRVTISARGADLTGQPISLAVKLYPDAPGSALLTLIQTATPGADGIRIVEVSYDADGVPTTIMEVLAAKEPITALPAAPEAGSDTVLAYDLQWTAPPEGPGFTAVERTVLFGNFIVRGSVNG